MTHSQNPSTQESHHPVRVWGISDVHIDYSENLEALLSLDHEDYQHDALIIAGDATDNMERLEHMLREMKQRFRWVGFVPGNHELWVTRQRKSHDTSQQQYTDSVEKFEAILSLCQEIGVFTTPQRIATSQQSVWLVPLFSWYHGPEENAASLYGEKASVQDRTQDMWSDFFFTQWPQWTDIDNVADYFLGRNTPQLSTTYDAPVISFSHFLPLQELLIPSAEEKARSTIVHKDVTPDFNFSRVAGTQIIDDQLRAIGSRLHLYGHQHRNRHRLINEVTYVSHCMGYPKERARGFIAEACTRPKLLWDSQHGLY